MNFHLQRGFTLLELLVVITVLSIVIVIGASAYINAASWMSAFGDERALDEHRAIANTLVRFAQESNNGQLPVPYTGNGFNSSCIDITNATQKAYLSDYVNTSIDSINSDGSVRELVRVCQRVSGQTYSQPVAGFGGETVSILYDAGVVYQTECPKASACNAGVPGSSGTYAATGWVVTAPDSKAVEFTTLPIQQAMWDETYKRLMELRDMLNNYRIDMVRTNASDDTTNWFHRPTLASEDMSGASAASNQGCYDGWYNLNDSNIDILEQFGWNKAYYSVTAGGAVIEACADYDPGDGGADTPPHVWALRINKNVSTLSAPDGADVTNNLIISF